MATGSTPIYNFTYPIADDPVNVHEDMQSLAEDIESALNSLDVFPSQTGNSGKFLTTDGSDLSWSNVDAFPSQESNAGKFLTTDGATTSWAVISEPSAATPTVLGTVYGHTSLSTGNIGIGYSSLGTQSASDNENVAIGFESLLNMSSTAFADIMIGYRSGYGISTGEYNIGIGGFNFWGTTTGDYNIAIGYEALPAYNSGGLTGADNVFIGHKAGYESTSGITGNIAIGNYALYYAENVNSTAVGHAALDHVTTGYSNVAVGYLAGSNITTGSNNIVIGTGSETTSPTTVNEIVIGNSNNSRFRVPGLGINWTANPTTTLPGLTWGEVKNGKSGLVIA